MGIQKNQAFQIYVCQVNSLLKCDLTYFVCLFAGLQNKLPVGMPAVSTAQTLVLLTSLRKHYTLSAQKGKECKPSEHRTAPPKFWFPKAHSCSSWGRYWVLTDNGFWIQLTYRKVSLVIGMLIKSNKEVPPPSSQKWAISFGWKNRYFSY